MACGRLPSRSRRSDGPACRLRGAGRRGARAAGDGVQGAKRVNKNLKGRAVEAGLGRGRRPPSGTAMRSTSLPPGRAMRIRHSQICPRPLSRQESYRPPPPLYPLPLPTPHGTRQPPRHSRHASARPRPGTPPPASGHRRAATQAKACGRGGEGAPAGRHTGRRTGRKVIAFRNNWLEQEQQGLACRGE